MAFFGRLPNIIIVCRTNKKHRGALFYDVVKFASRMKGLIKGIFPYHIPSKTGNTAYTIRCVFFSQVFRIPLCVADRAFPCRLS